MTARPPSPRAWRWSALERAGRPCREPAVARADGNNIGAGDNWILVGRY
jgi:hypothetical protein